MITKEKENKIKRYEVIDASKYFIKIDTMKLCTPEFIRYTRFKQKLDTIDFAIVFGLDHKVIESWEAGTSKPSFAESVILYLINDKPELVSKWIKEHLLDIARD